MLAIISLIMLIYTGVMLRALVDSRLPLAFIAIYSAVLVCIYFFSARSYAVRTGSALGAAQVGMSYRPNLWQIALVSSLIGVAFLYACAFAFADSFYRDLTSSWRWRRYLLDQTLILFSMCAPFIAQAWAASRGLKLSIRVIELSRRDEISPPDRT
ncbi:MAG: hypothetical protein JNL71_06470 [Rhodospirillales bacterium]|nr:hypothetical protein [Rhodospirillales bacterium]